MDSHCPKGGRTGWMGGRAGRPAQGGLQSMVAGASLVTSADTATSAFAEPTKDPNMCFEYLLSGTRLEPLMLTLEK